MSIMERGRLGRIGLATVLASLLLGTLSSNTSEASLIRAEVEQKPVYYLTSGTVGTPGGAPVDSLDFVGVTGSPVPELAPVGVFYTPGAFSLGGFRTHGLPPGGRRTFDALPFSITLSLFSNPVPGPVISQIQIDGVLDGELSNTPGTGLLATVTSIAQVGTPIGTPPFRVEDLSVLAPQYILPSGPLPTVTTPIFGYVDAQVPEPTALATLGLGVAVLAVSRHRRHRARDRARATA